MRMQANIAAVAFASVAPIASFACTIPVFADDALNRQRDYENRVEAVRFGAQCAFAFRSYDNFFSGDAAIDLGEGRVAQKIGDNDAVALVADCDRREATLLLGSEPEAIIMGCGVEYDNWGPLFGNDATPSLTTGQTLAELEEAVLASGGRVVDPIDLFNTFGSDDEAVPAAAQVDLLCGCKLYYPNSAGASS